MSKERFAYRNIKRIRRIPIRYFPFNFCLKFKMNHDGARQNVCTHDHVERPIRGPSDPPLPSTEAEAGATPRT